VQTTLHFHLFERTFALSKKILIASRHSIVRHGINLMVHAATPHTVISDDRPLRQVAADLAFIQPDLAIVDLMGRAESVDVAAHLFQSHEAIETGKLLLLLDPEAAEAGTATLMQRAHGIVTSSCEPVQILRTIETMLNGQTDAAPSFGGDAGSALRIPAPCSDAALAAAKIVTPREKQVIELVRRGLCNKRIARDLGISLTTVRTHRQKLMAKLGLHNAVEIAQFAANAQL